jgi:PAS domain S-box-containing protein
MILELAAGLLTLSTPVAAGAAAAIGLALARRPRRSPAFRALFLSASLVTAWLGASALTRQAATPELARRWAALGLAAAALLPPAVHRIAATYGATSSFARWSQRLGWLLALPLVALALGDGLVAPALETRLVTSIQPRPWGLQPLYGSLIWAWVGYWLALWLLGLYETWALAPELGPGRRRSTLWLAAAVALAGGGALDLLPGLGRPVPPFGALPLLAFVVLAAGAFRRPAPEIPDETAREILSVMADGLLVCDARGRIEQVNEALCSLAGRSRRQLIGKSIETVLPGSETGRFEDSATLVPAAGDPVEVRVSASPIRGEGGIRATVVVVRDLRESRRVQELVADRERRLGDIEELAGCGHWTWVAGDETVLGSPGLFRVLDLPEPTKGIRWQTFLQRFDAEDRGALRDGLERALRDRELFEQVGRIRRASGDIRFVHVRGGVDADDAGEGEEPATMTGTVQDVTERREAEARFESLLESAADPMVIVDSEGTITRVNQRLEAEFGYRREELVGQPVEILIPEGRRGEHSRLRAGYMAHPIPRPLGTGVELLGRRKDGSEIPVDIRLSPTSGPDGELVTAAVRNISERKRLEGELSHMAFHDPLTDLPNRAALMNRLRRAVGRARPGDDPSFALLCIGLDRFEDRTDSEGSRTPPVWRTGFSGSWAVEPSWRDRRCSSARASGSLCRTRAT